MENLSLYPFEKDKKLWKTCLYIHLRVVKVYNYFKYIYRFALFEEEIWKWKQYKQYSVNGL